VVPLRPHPEMYTTRMRSSRLPDCTTAIVGGKRRSPNRPGTTGERHVAAR
jgi:hypothetical protein